MPIARFTVVRLATAGIGGKPGVEPLDAAYVEQPGLLFARATLGVTMAESNFLNPVGVMSAGHMHRVVDVNTEGWVAGDLLWCAAQGFPSKTRPAAPFPQVYVGQVTLDNGDATFEVDVNVQVIPAIAELSGVYRQTGITDRAFLKFHSGDSIWYPEPLHRTVEVNTSYSPTENECYLDTILCDASGGWFTVTLPFSADWPRRFEVKKIDASRNIVRLASSGYEPIEGGNPHLKLQGESLTIQSDSTQWWVI